MKTRLLQIAAIVMIAFSSFQYTAAQTQIKKFDTDEKKIAFASKNLLMALKSDNSGVIEGAMRVTAQMKMQYPQANVTSLVKAIVSIQEEHPSGTIRYKAYITRAICEIPDWYSTEPSITNADDKTFYRAASKRMQEQLLTSNF